MRPACYGKMYEPEPTDACMTCKAFKKCKEIGWGHPDMPTATDLIPMEPTKDTEWTSRW